MRLTNDDDTSTVDNKFLGPAGYTLPWEARFVSYAIWAGLFVLAIWFERMAGFRGFFPSVFAIIAAVGGTMWIGSFITFEVPMRTLAAVFWHEVTAPRQRPVEPPATFTPATVKIDAPRLRDRARQVARWIVTPAYVED